MKLKDARLCIECDEVFEGRSCPVCDSGEGWPIINWLNNENKGEQSCSSKSDQSHMTIRC